MNFIPPSLYAFFVAATPTLVAKLLSVFWQR